MKEKKKLPPVLENLVRDGFRFSQEWNNVDLYRKRHLRLYYNPSTDRVVNGIYIMKEGKIDMGKNVYDSYNNLKKRRR